MGKRVIAFIKKEMVFCVVTVLAMISMFIITPSTDYIGYIDIKVLAILFALMLVVQGLSMSGFFTWLMYKMLKYIHNTRELCLLMILCTFVASMFITNDVSLITFVPFAILVLKETGKRKCIIFTVTMQTIAANMGSMIFPTGNPHNLYLYSVSNMGMMDFLKLMMPYAVTALVMLCVSVFLIKNEKVSLNEKGECILNRKVFWIMASAFVICILAVVKLVPYQMSVVLVVLMVLAVDRTILKKADYILLLTFVMFFIFVGNIKNIEVVKDFLESVTSEHELLVGILLSQVISNVPASMLLAGFTTNFANLVLGVNIGGLGTLIASMANLISYKIYAADKESRPGRYIRYFSVMCIIFLIVLICVHKLTLMVQNMCIA